MVPPKSYRLPLPTLFYEDVVQGLYTVPQDSNTQIPSNRGPRKVSGCYGFRFPLVSGFYFQDPLSCLGNSQQRSFDNSSYVLQV